MPLTTHQQESKFWAWLSAHDIQVKCPVCGTTDKKNLVVGDFIEARVPTTDGINHTVTMLQLCCARCAYVSLYNFEPDDIK